MRRLILTCTAYTVTWALAAHAMAETENPNAPRGHPSDCLGPVAAAASSDGSLLFVAAADAKQILVVDTRSRTVIRSIDVPASPTGMVLAPSGEVLYVTCAAPKSTVCAIDVASQKMRTAIPARHTATGLAISPDESTLYVCNRFNNSVSVIDASTGTERAVVPATREPVGAVIMPDGASVFVINHLPNDRADGFDVAAEITVIETATNRTSRGATPRA